MKHTLLTALCLLLFLSGQAQSTEKSIYGWKEVDGVPLYRLTPKGPLKSGLSTGSPGGGSSANPYFDVVFPATAADLNTAIASCTKPVLYVVGTTLTIERTLVVSNKAKLAIVGMEMDIVLTSWNSGEQGILFDLRGNLTDIIISGFRFNCPLPSTSGNGDGGGYGIVAARGAICPLIDNLTIQNCFFISPNLHQNAISLVCVGWGGYGIRRNVTVRNCKAESIKRMFFECTNQEDPYTTNGTVRYNNIRVENCYARNLGNGGVGSSGGMMVSFDGPGTNNEVRGNTVINPYFVAYEAVGTSNVRFVDNVADYEPGYTADYVGYSFTDGQHGANFGPSRLSVTGGQVRCTGRGYNLTYATNCSFHNVSFTQGKGNTLVNASANTFRNCSFVGISTNEFLTSFQTSASNVFTDCYLGNERTSDNSGGRCTLVLFDAGCVNNRFLYLRHYQEKRGNTDWYESTYLNFSGGTTNQVIGNQSNNPSPGF